MNKSLETFYGYIDKIYDDSVDVIMEASSNYEEVWAVILIEKIPVEERKYISVGALFELEIFDGYWNFEFDKKVRTEEEINNINKEAEKLFNLMNKVMKND